MQNVKSIAVVGLGSMGMGAAKSCIRAGLDVYGVDLDPISLEEIKKYGAKAVSGDTSRFAHSLDAVLLLVVNSKQVKSILFDSGLVDKLKENTAVMICTTISSQDAKEIESGLKSRNLIMLDAPVSGGAGKAEAGSMTVMASGSPIAFQRMAPVLDAIADKVYNVGDEIGLGATVKIVHQLLAGVHIAAAAEAMALASKTNIPLELMYDIVTNSAGNSWMFEDRMRHVIDGDYSPNSMVNIFVKDLKLVSDAAGTFGMSLPLSSTALDMFTSASKAGFGEEDDSAVIKIFEGVNLPESRK